MRNEQVFLRSVFAFYRDFNNILNRKIGILIHVHNIVGEETRLLSNIIAATTVRLRANG